MTKVVVKRRTPSEDELMHAKYVKKDKINGKWRYYYDHNDGQGNKTGVTVDKNKNGTTVELFDTRNTKYWDKNQKSSKKSYGPVTVRQAEDGVSYSITLPSKKKIAAKANKSIRKAKKQVKKGKKWLSKLFN